MCEVDGFYCLDDGWEVVTVWIGDVGLRLRWRQELEEMKGAI
jgi:hypothetical protein